MTNILKKITEHKKLELAHLKKDMPLAALLNMPQTSIRDFIKPLRSSNPAIIAEIKQASPSKGIIRADFNVANIAEIYSQHGAQCLSVLTEVDFFKGDPSYLGIAKAHCQLPILRKDFIIDPYQIYESRVIGADCILLIVALLDDYQLQDYCQLAQALGMAVLVESHTLNELERALTLPTDLIGINNRSLETFHTDLQVSIDLKKYIPSSKLVISESGINTPADIKLMQSNGIHTFLIGESLMRSKNIGAMLDELIH